MLPRRGHPLVGLLILAVVACIAAELGARALIRSRITAAVAAREPSARNITTTLGLPVLPDLIGHGEVSSVTVVADQVSLGPLTAQQVTATATGVHLDVRSSLTQQHAVVTGIDHVTFRASLTPDEVSHALPGGASVVFGPGTVTVRLGGVSLPGTIEVAAGKVVFVLPGIRLPLSLSGYPFAGCVSTATVTVSQATLTCALDHPGTDLFPHR